MYVYIATTLILIKMLTVIRSVLIGLFSNLEQWLCEHICNEKNMISLGQNWT